MGANISRCDDAEGHASLAAITPIDVISVPIISGDVVRYNRGLGEMSGRELSALEEIGASTPSPEAKCS